MNTKRAKQGIFRPHQSAAANERSRDDVNRREMEHQLSRMFQPCGGGRRIIRKKIKGD